MNHWKLSHQSSRDCKGTNLQNKVYGEFFRTDYITIIFAFVISNYKHPINVITNYTYSMFAHLGFYQISNVVANDRKKTSSC